MPHHDTPGPGPQRRATRTRPGRRRGGRLALLASTAVALAAIGLVFAFVMAAWHRDVGRMLGASGASVAAAVAGEVDRNVELLDFSLLAVAEHWAMPAVRDLPVALRDLLLFDSATRAPGFGALTILDRDGRVVAGSGEEGRVGASFGDRDYFRVHANIKGLGLFISRPFRSPRGDRWILALSRRVAAPDGGFDGVVVGTLDVEYLAKLYAGLDVGPDAAVALFRTDGTIVTRQPFDGAAPRQWVGGGDSFNRMRAARAGTFEGDSPVDGRRRVIAFHRVGATPLIQAVEVGGGDDYAAWWRRAAAVGSLLTVLCFAVMALSAVLHRELGRRSAAEAELSRLAGTDALTGLANRRRFEAAMADAWARAAGADLALLMVDVDSFKAYNDLFGHAAGDGALRAVAASLDAHARARGGLAGRWGGEEFAVLLPGYDGHTALLVAESMRAAVEALGLPHPRGVGGVVTVSAGALSARPAAGGLGHEALAGADAALYLAKAEGRNRCRGAAPVAGPLAAAA